MLNEEELMEIAKAIGAKSDIQLGSLQSIIADELLCRIIPIMVIQQARNVKAYPQNKSALACMDAFKKASLEELVIWNTGIASEMGIRRNKKS